MTDHVRVTADDTADGNPKVLANHLRHLQAAVEAGFERMDVRFGMIMDKVLNALDDMRRDVVALEKRVAALESRPTRARKKR